MPKPVQSITMVMKIKRKAFLATSWMIIHPYYAAAIGGAITVSVIVVGAGIIQYSNAKNNLANVESRYIIPIINKHRLLVQYTTPLREGLPHTLP